MPQVLAGDPLRVLVPAGGDDQLVPAVVIGIGNGHHLLEVAQVETLVFLGQRVQGLRVRAHPVGDEGGLVDLLLPFPPHDQLVLAVVVEVADHDRGIEALVLAKAFDRDARGNGQVALAVELEDLDSRLTRPEAVDGEVFQLPVIVHIRNQRLLTRAGELMDLPGFDVRQTFVEVVPDDLAVPAVRGEDLQQAVCVHVMDREVVGVGAPVEGRSADEPLGQLPAVGLEHVEEGRP